jgi:hypothetical protein
LTALRSIYSAFFTLRLKILLIIKECYMLRKALLFMAIILSAFQILPADQIGSETVLDIASPELAGRGAFVTSQGGAPASVVNPAAGGDAQRIVFDAGALFLISTSAGGDLGTGLELGALFPTKYAVFGGSLHFLTSPGFDGYYPVGRLWGQPEHRQGTVPRL